MAVEDKEERREEERARGELGMMEEVEGGEVKLQDWLHCNEI